MNRFNFFGIGLLNGVVLSGRHEAIASYSYDKKAELKFAAKERFVSLKDIPVIRGFFALLGYLITFFKAFDLSLIVYNDKLLAGDVEHKLAMRKKLIKFYFLVLISAFVCFLALPVGVYLLLYLFVKNSLANVIMLFLRGLSLVLFFLSLKLFKVSTDIYKYNGAINKVNNAMFGRKNLEYKDVERASLNSVYSASNFMVFSLIICFMLVPLFTFKVHFLLNVLIKILLSLLLICLSYELLMAIENTYRTNKFVKVLAYPILGMSRLTTSPCKEQHIMAVTYAYEELIQMTKTKTKFNEDRESFRKVYNDIKQKLFAAGITEDREADYLICDSLGLDRTELVLKDSFSKEEIATLNKVLKQRLNHKPLCKILNKKNFYGRDFFVNNDVLSPRQETELLTSKVIEDIQRKVKKSKVLDLCTGSGAIGITIALESDCQVVASDKSKKALVIAQKNAKTYGAKVTFCQSDMFKDLNEKNKFDIIVSNPPYIPTNDIQNLDTEVKDFDPILALDGGFDGLDFYKIIANKAADFLKKDGKLYLEIGYDQAASVTALLRKNFVEIQVLKDYDDLDRIIIARKG